jgi:probable phosphoglycerate mutase
MIYLIRHGQTRWNRDGRIQGQLDSELTDLGVEQAHAVGRLLRGHVVGQSSVEIESSPTGRALATARIVANEVGLDVTAIRMTQLLAERHMGRWAGLTLDEVERAYPTIDVRRTIDDPAFVPPGGESFDALAARARSWLAGGRAAAVTIAVTHGLIGRTIRGAYQGLSPAATMAGRHPQDRVFRLHAGAIDELIA